MKNTHRKWWWPFCCGTVVINKNYYYNKKRKSKKKKNAFELNKGKVLKYDPKSRTGLIESNNKRYKLTPETILIDPIKEGMMVDFTGLRTNNQKITPIMNDLSQSDYNPEIDYSDTALSVAVAKGDPPTGQLEPIRTSGPGGKRMTSSITVVEDPCGIFSPGTNNLYFIADDSGVGIYESSAVYSSGHILSQTWTEKADGSGGTCTAILSENGVETEYIVYI